MRGGIVQIAARVDSSVPDLLQGAILEDGIFGEIGGRQIGDALAQFGRVFLEEKIDDAGLVEEGEQRDEGGNGDLEESHGEGVLGDLELVFLGMGLFQHRGRIARGDKEGGDEAGLPARDEGDAEGDDEDEQEDEREHDPREGGERADEVVDPAAGLGVADDDHPVLHNGRGGGVEAHARGGVDEDARDGEEVVVVGRGEVDEVVERAVLAGVDAEGVGEVGVDGEDEAVVRGRVGARERGVRRGRERVRQDDERRLGEEEVAGSVLAARVEVRGGGEGRQTGGLAQGEGAVAGLVPREGLVLREGWGKEVEEEEEEEEGRERARGTGVEGHGWWGRGGGEVGR